MDGQTEAPVCVCFFLFVCLLSVNRNNGFRVSTVHTATVPLSAAFSPLRLRRTIYVYTVLYHYEINDNDDVFGWS